jgi:hypothetical protein
MNKKPIVYCKPQLSSRETEYLRLGRLQLEQYRKESRDEWSINLFGAALAIGLVFTLAALIQ